MSRSIRPFYVLLAAAVQFSMLVRQVARFLLILYARRLATRSTYLKPFPGSPLSARLRTPTLWPCQDTCRAKDGCSNDPTGRTTSRTYSSSLRLPALTHDSVPVIVITHPISWVYCRAKCSFGTCYTIAATEPRAPIVHWSNEQAEVLRERSMHMVRMCKAQHPGLLRSGAGPRHGTASAI
jgi:hypothetical protein